MNGRVLFAGIWESDMNYTIRPFLSSEVIGTYESIDAALHAAYEFSRVHRKSMIVSWKDKEIAQVKCLDE